MTRQPGEARDSALYDSASVYGWISILLHWLTAIVIIALWFLGKSIVSASTEDADARRALHVSIAASAWLILLFRLLWRLRSGHPQVRGQSRFIHRIAKAVHYAMLLVIASMLASGPFLVWANGHPVQVFGAVSIPGPVGASESLHEAAWFVHENMALLLLVLVVAHLGGTLKHLMFHSDDTIVRMLWPAKGIKNE